MDLGIALPTANTPLTSPQNIIRLAEEAENLGYAAAWTYERLLYPTAPISQAGRPPGPLDEVYRVAYDPLETLAYVGARTRHLKLGTSVIDALFHPPVVLARRFATLDQLSGGRVIAGLGQGWMPQEFAAAGVPMSRRGAGMDEFVAALRAVWGPDPVQYEGRFYQIPESILNPKPVQPGGPPILIGAMTPAGIQRAARIADGINPIAISRPALEGAVTGFRAAAQAAGRDVSALTIMVRVNQTITDQPLPPESRPYLGGSPDQIAADLAALQPLHIDQVFFRTGFAPSLDDQIRLLDRLQRAVPQTQ